MMVRTQYFNYIDDKLSSLSTQLKNRGKLNLLDSHVLCENFFALLLNYIFGWQLYNLNASQQNVEGIDLIDENNKLLVQVSATNTKEKIENSLKKDILKNYPGYTFKFLSIASEASALRSKKYATPSNINFVPDSDIVDIPLILRKIITLKVEQQKMIYEFIKKELGGEIDIIKLDSNLAGIINILSLEKWDDTEVNPETRSFEIERKISFNNLKTTKYLIDDYAIHYGRLDQKYKEFDSLGVNKSYSVLQFIRKSYIKNLVISDVDELFMQIIEDIKNAVVNSANYKEIPIDELDLSVNILVVDAFIRCKIFNNPKDYNYVTS